MLILMVPFNFSLTNFDDSKLSVTESDQQSRIIGQSYAIENTYVYYKC